jgi:hypothetical protein
MVVAGTVVATVGTVVTVTVTVVRVTGRVVGKTPGTTVVVVATVVLDDVTPATVVDVTDGARSLAVAFLSNCAGCWGR